MSKKWEKGGKTENGCDLRTDLEFDECYEGAYYFKLTSQLYLKIKEGFWIKKYK